MGLLCLAFVNPRAWSRALAAAFVLTWAFWAFDCGRVDPGPAPTVWRSQAKAAR